MTCAETLRPDALDPGARRDDGIERPLIPVIPAKAEIHVRARVPKNGFPLSRE